MRTQREFIMATAKQTIQAKNVFKIGEIIDLVYEYVDTNLSISFIKDYVPYAVNVNVDEIKSAYLPGESVGPPQGIQYWFFQVDEDETEELVQELYYSTDDTTSGEGETSTGTDSSTGTTGTETDDNTSSSDDETTSSSVTKTEASKIKIEILNGSGSSSKLSEVKKALTNKGYKVTKTNTTTSTTKTTIINKTDVDEKIEQDIKGILGVGNISSSTATSSNVDITIIIGKDYK